jgi:hypothetical protein
MTPRFVVFLKSGVEMETSGPGQVPESEKGGGVAAVDGEGIFSAPALHPVKKPPESCFVPDREIQVIEGTAILFRPEEQFLCLFKGTGVGYFTI